jgi:hypothetical protein
MAGSTERDLVQLLAAWALVHETADEGWKAAVERGLSAEPGDMKAGPDGFVDGLSAMIAAEKDRLKGSLAAADGSFPSSDDDAGSALLEEVRFELGEMRSRLEAIETSLDAIVRRLDAGSDPAR